MDRLQMDVRYTDALSGEFKPACDRSNKSHTLARLACGVYEKGRGPEDCRDYVPSWAPNTYAMLKLSDGLVQEELVLGKTVGILPRQVRFAHEILQLNLKHILIIEDHNASTVCHYLDGMTDPKFIRQDVVERAGDFYS